MALPRPLLADVTDQQQMNVAVEPLMNRVDVCGSNLLREQRGLVERRRRIEEKLESCRESAMTGQRMICASLKTAKAKQLESDAAYQLPAVAATRKRRRMPPVSGTSPPSLKAAATAESPPTPGSECTVVVEAAEVWQDEESARSKSLRTFLSATLWLCG